MSNSIYTGRRLNLEWEAGFSASQNERPEKYFPASVPGNVQLDMAAKERYPDWKNGLNFKMFRWCEDVFWIYRAEFLRPELTTDETLWFFSGGIDYRYDVLFNGKHVYSHEGMFKPFELELTERLRDENIIEIVIYPVPLRKNVPIGRQRVDASVKPAVSYGWDWHPHLVPTGLWEDAGLVIKQSKRIDKVEVAYTLSEDLSVANLHFETEVLGGELRYTLYDPEGEVVYKNESPSFLLEKPVLWWCRGYGEPKMYRYLAELLDNGKVIDSQSGRFGIRRIRLVMSEGSWDVPYVHPISRCPAPSTLELNGVRVFAKGTNWVNPEVFTGTITRSRYEELLCLARDANFNLLRCWGGAIVNKKSFFELCDEYGIMVWQEFTLACRSYSESDEYLRVLESEARAIIARLRHHPCLAIWCGGNELYNHWSRMTDQSLPLRLLNSLCYELDRKTPFMATSPLYGMAHGCYLFNYPDGREVFEVMPGVKYTAYTEFGVPALSNKNCCLMTADESELFPFEENEVTKAHHAFGTWDVHHDSWYEKDSVEKYFGEPQSLDEIICYSQWLQSEGYKCIFEEARRQKPYCGMALNWCYCDPWPALANNSIVCYPADPKPAYYAVADSCRPALASARIPHFSWKAGENFEIELFILNDGRNALPAGEVNVYIELDGQSYQLAVWKYDAVPANENLRGPKAGAVLPNVDVKNVPMTLVLDAGGLSSCYKLLYSRTAHAKDNEKSIC